MGRSILLGGRLGRPVAIFLTFVAALAAIAGPVLLAVHLSSVQGKAAARERALAYALRVIDRTDNIAAQVGEVTTWLGANRPDFPCEPSYVESMKRVALQSIYIQAIGHVVKDYMVCSSLGDHGTGLPLGEPDVETAAGVRIRANVRLPLAPNTNLIAIENRTFAAILHSDMPISVVTVESDVGLSVFSWRNRRLLSTRGALHQEWLSALPEGAFQKVFEDDGHVVAVVRSERFGTPAAIAAIPLHYLDERAHQFAVWFVPAGLIMGLALAMPVFYFGRRLNDMPALLRAALKRNEFFLVYQPVVELAGGRWVGVEALIRWKRPSGEFVRPDVFIQAAEDCGLIPQITERVIDLVRADAPVLIRGRRRFHIGINLAAADLESERTVELLRGLSRDIGAGIGTLMVEATERGFLRADVARRIVKEIRAQDIEVAIDDFGTGYSSLSQLQSLELDYLKIDKSFVDTIGTGSATSGVIPHIIEMAKSLELAMIAEGVETEAQAQYLREHGVQYAQGWLFGKPMPVRDIVAGLEAQGTPRAAG
jgi:sensor c-di-GMP phosphodiesterase-like protein